MARDIVQFVQFSEYKDKSYMELAMATLDEARAGIGTAKHACKEQSTENIRT